MWYLINKSLNAALGMSNLTSPASWSIACGCGRSCLELLLTIQKSDPVEEDSFPHSYSLYPREAWNTFTYTVALWGIH